MFRAISARKSRREQYHHLHDDGPSPEATLDEPKLSRSKSLQAKILDKIMKTPSRGTTDKKPSEEVELKKASKVHPFFSLFEMKRKKKATAKPEFSRYVEYVKEGGS